MALSILGKSDSEMMLTGMAQAEYRLYVMRLLMPNRYFTFTMVTKKNGMNHPFL
jgi:hypothetical protein